MSRKKTRFSDATVRVRNNKTKEDGIINKVTNIRQTNNGPLVQPRTVTGFAGPSIAAASSTYMPMGTSNDWPKLAGLRFAPSAWAKLLHMLHSSSDEVGMWGISDATQLLLIREVRLVKQRVSMASTKFDDDAVADYLLDCGAEGIGPERCGRIWIHTHPGSGVTPSGTDETTFLECLGPCHWGVMMVVGRGHETYARLRFNVGPGFSTELPVSVDWSATGGSQDVAAWQAEYTRCVTKCASVVQYPTNYSTDGMSSYYTRHYHDHSVNQGNYGYQSSYSSQTAHGHDAWAEAARSRAAEPMVSGYTGHAIIPPTPVSAHAAVSAIPSTTPAMNFVTGQPTSGSSGLVSDWRNQPSARVTGNETKPALWPGNRGAWSLGLSAYELSAIEEWARIHGMQVPSRTSEAWLAMYGIWNTKQFDDKVAPADVEAPKPDDIAVVEDVQMNEALDRAATLAID